MMGARTMLTMMMGLAALAGPAGAETPPASKAYIIFEIGVTDAELYKSYVAKATVAAAKYGGAYLVRGGRTEPLEGAPPAGRVVIMEFPNLAAAHAFQASPEEQEAIAIRRRAATVRQFIVEGVTPSAP